MTPLIRWVTERTIQSTAKTANKGEKVMSSKTTTTENIDTKTTPETTSSDRELIISRIIDAPRERVFKAWTDPELLKQWFAPLPYTTPVAELDVRPGGANLIVMRDPAGNEFPNRGVYLEVVKNERIVFTNAYTEAWEPSEKPFMTVILTFENEGGKTKYTAACFTGRLPTAKRTKRWASTKAGASAPTSLWRS